MGKHVQLRLKLRPVRTEFARIDLDSIRSLLSLPLEEGSRRALELMKSAAEVAPERKEHDSRWLIEIAQYVSPASREGIKLSDAARWFPLIQRLAAVDTTKEVLFKISEAQADLIFDRLKNEFSLLAIPTNFVLFCLDFWKTIKRQPDSIKPDDFYTDGSESEAEPESEAESEAEPEKE